MKKNDNLTPPTFYQTCKQEGLDGTAEQRVAAIKQHMGQLDLSPTSLTSYATWILNGDGRVKKKEEGILDKNRMVTINSREVMVGSFGTNHWEEGGVPTEEMIHNMVVDNKNLLFINRDKIPHGEEAKKVPGLFELQTAIEEVDEKYKGAEGTLKGKLLQQLMEMRYQQYELWQSAHPSIKFVNAIHGSNKLELSDKVVELEDEKGNITLKPTAPLSLLDPTSISALLIHYSSLIEESYGLFDSDIGYLMKDLEDLIGRVYGRLNDEDRTIEQKTYLQIIIDKIDGLTSAQIISHLKELGLKSYTPEYLSKLWRKTIPKQLATQAQKEWLEWNYVVNEKGNWKRCNKCGQYKLAHPFFFSRNKKSKDGWYSICKECRRVR